VVFRALHPAGDVLPEALRLVDDLACHGQQLSVALLQFFLHLRSLAAAGPRNLHRPMPDRAHAVAQLRPRSPGQLRNLLHRARQYPRAIAEQTAVRWVVNVFFNDRRIQAKLASPHDLLSWAMATSR
jgi:hypothetical protein